ncbi:CHASE2 domain protein [Stanieria cyanosphaera PCC 7437]|uniref:CHASE2 domain protein n=1 Tax=Stanieria cyanosphaera (strain ATCC 29371 / PCC 7437) TaxID=111780 RepID=K9Y0M5_STAC7|nr:CHASE2 domain-containing protein [Stanieria cyanosphaera]AFZ37941.1 CHASE2 domain protein [Stanieria cyanosphaera PCC 7437]
MNPFFWQSLKQKFKQELIIWRIGAMPGILVISLIVLARVTGNLQFLELAAFDRFLRLRPIEPTDERILIVGIDEEDVQKIETYPIPDRDLSALIEKIASNHPAVIGVDIIRDLPVPPEDAEGYARLVRVWQKYQNLIGVDKALPDRGGNIIKPPPSLPPERVGFIDAVLDESSLRRIVLSTSNLQGEYRESLIIKLAQIYLAKQGWTMENVPDDEWSIAFNDKALPRLQPNSGAYVRVNSGGNQILLNPRSNQTPFTIVSLEDIKNGKVSSQLIRDRIVLIGVTTLTAKDIINVPGIPHRPFVYGIELQAHAISQIVNGVLEQRPLIKTWTDGWEYVWIIFWGLIGISLSRFLRSPWSIFVGLGITGIILIGICYGALLLGWWIPVIPSLLVLSINAAGLTASLFYRYRQELEYLKLRSQDRQKSIERIFDAIHAQPLQTLAQLSSKLKQFNFVSPEDKNILVSQSEQLDLELRELRDSISREMIRSENIIFINEVQINLQNPLQDILYQTYDEVMRRDLPCFPTIKVRIPNFKELDESRLSLEQKSDLCRFLEEALINVGKYAEGVTRLKVSCGQEKEQNFIRVEDNGIGVEIERQTEQRQTGGWGSKAAKNLAWQLGGKFQRRPNFPKGTVCELTWAVNKSWFWFF